MSRAARSLPSEMELGEAREAFEAAGLAWQDLYGEVAGATVGKRIAEAESCFASADLALLRDDRRSAIAWLLLARAWASALIERMEAEVEG